MKRLYTVSSTNAKFTVLLTKENNLFIYSTDDGRAVAFSHPLKTKEDFALLGALFGHKFSTGYSEETGNVSSFSVQKEDI